MRRWLALGLLTAALLPSCAYFNALYNARRLFAEAERAAARGENARAFTAYGSSIEKAAKSLRQDPDGRWADDALYLIARAHFWRAEDAAARAALLRLLEKTRDTGMRASAQAYLGAAEVRLSLYAPAVERLNAALAAAGGREELSAFARLWRARARFGADDEEGAWADLTAAARTAGRTGGEARLEAVSRAVDEADGGRAPQAFAALLRDADGYRWADSLRASAERAAQLWGAARARELLAPLPEAPWPPRSQGGLALFRAELAARAGDTATAIAEARLLAERAAVPTSERARVALARWQLAGMRELGDAAQIRALLLPALADAQAQALLRSLKTLAVLLERARETAQPLAIFAAAELARDELGAPALARSLFLTYAELVPQATWAPKALLAAAATGPAPDQAQSIRQLLSGYGENPYVAALSGSAAEEPFRNAEERLARTLAVLREEASREADRRDALVIRAVALLDSVKAAARADSMKLVCGAMLDTLGIAGVKADSVRVACVRGDSLRVDSILKLDTFLADSARVPQDTAFDARARAAPPPQRRDTIL